MRKIFLKHLALSITLVAFISGTVVFPANAKRVAQAGNTAQRSSESKQTQYAEILRQRAAAAARAKEKLKKIQATAREVTSTIQKKKSPKTKVSFFFSSADTQGGIVGGVSDKATGAAILFESKREGGNLTSSIKDLAGQTLIEYVEANQTPAERKLELFNWSWKGSIDPVFREFAY